MIRSGDSSRGYFTRSNCRWKEGMHADQRFWGQSLNVRFAPKADILRRSKMPVVHQAKISGEGGILMCGIGPFRIAR